MKVFLCALTAFVLLSGTCYAYGEKSHGYRMGMLTHYQESGYLIKSGEGELNMGNDGTPLFEVQNNGKSRKKVYINPWRFSHEEYQSDYQGYVGQYVWIEYTKELGQVLPVTKTKYRAVKIGNIEKGTSLQSSFFTEKREDIKSTGVQVGRIVQLSETGVAIKSFEATVQCGTGGNQYKFMSVVEDEDFYDYLICALKEGRLLKIYFDNKGIMSNFDIAHNTKYRIYGVELLD